MTKKHFEAFAKEIKNLVEKDRLGILKDQAKVSCDIVCRVSKQFNPNFKEGRELERLLDAL